MAHRCIHSEEPYYVGEIVELIHAVTPAVVVEVLKDGRAVAYALRRNDHGGEIVEPGRKCNPVSPRSGARLPPFTGKLTDEESALAMKYILLEGANNG